MSRVIEQKQMKDFFKIYTDLVERCFESCCNDFTSKSLSSKEVRSAPMPACAHDILTDRLAFRLQDTCVNNCTQKFLKHSERVGARFGEEK